VPATAALVVTLPLTSVPPWQSATATKLPAMHRQAREREVSLQFPAVVGPMQERLPLPSAARQITRLARKLKLSDVTPDCFPAFDLSNVYPSFPAPFRERLTRFDTEVVE